jgi:hypothetical protein
MSSLAAVESMHAILRRFSAAMSYGAVGKAHSTLAVAMNRLDAMSNSGEGGESRDAGDTDRNDRRWPGPLYVTVLPVSADNCRSRYLRLEARRGRPATW